MSNIGRSGYGVAMAALLLAMMAGLPSPAAALSQKEAMTICRMKYGMGVTSVTIRKNGHIVCQEGPSRNATRQQVFDYCKKRSGATMAKIRKLSNGKWECRHNGYF